jgi:hypothetical protein
MAAGIAAALHEDASVRREYAEGKQRDDGHPLEGVEGYATLALKRNLSTARRTKLARCWRETGLVQMSEMV